MKMAVHLQISIYTVRKFWERTQKLIADRASFSLHNHFLRIELPNLKNPHAFIRLVSWIRAEFLLRDMGYTLSH
jgi:hypothetical protein